MHLWIVLHQEDIGCRKIHKIAILQSLRRWISRPYEWHLAHSTPTRAKGQFHFSFFVLTGFPGQSWGFLQGAATPFPAALLGKAKVADQKSANCNELLDTATLRMAP